MFPWIATYKIAPIAPATIATNTLMINPTIPPAAPTARPVAAVPASLPNAKPSAENRPPKTRLTIKTMTPATKCPTPVAIPPSMAGWTKEEETPQILAGRVVTLVAVVRSLFSLGNGAGDLLVEDAHPFRQAALEVFLEAALFERIGGLLHLCPRAL